MKRVSAYHRSRSLCCALVMLSVVALTAVGQSSGGSFQIVSHVIAGGGGGPSTDSGNLSLDGTIAGTSAGPLLLNPPFSLTGGFWPPLQKLSPFCVPGDGSIVRVGSTVRCFFFAEGTGVQFSDWRADGFAPESSVRLNKTFHTERPGPASITATWFDSNGGHSETFRFTIKHGHKEGDDDRDEDDDRKGQDPG